MSGANSNPPQDETHQPFHTTHWSVVLGASEANSDVAAAALEKLCRAYWYPIYGDLRRRGHSPHDAQDLTQEFFACLLRRESFAAARRDRGRFRSYLLGALDYFLADKQKGRHAAKRGGGQPALSLDELVAEARYEAEPVTHETPERLFDRRWRIALMEQALSRLTKEFEASGKSAFFAVLKPYLAMETSEEGYADASSRLGMTPEAIGVAVHRLRRRYRELIRAEVMETLVNPTDAEDELRWLLSV